MRNPLVTLGIALALSLQISPITAAFAAPAPRLPLSVAPSLSPSPHAASVSPSAIVDTALRYVGYPYTTVGNSPSTGFSCIGFVSYVYQSNGIPLPDDLWGAMAYAPAVSFADLVPGDVLYFQNTVWSGLSHTAIYLGGGRIVHAEWYTRGVVTSSLTGDPVDGDYWTQHYLGANRPWAMNPTMSTNATSPTADTAPVAAVQSAPILRSGPRAEVQVAGLNVRKRPSLFGPIRHIADQGTSVVVLKQYRNWYWVQLPGGSFGWVFGTGIGRKQTSSVPSRHLPSTRIAVNGLRVRARPGLAAPVLTSAYRGERVRILRFFGTWMRVLTADGVRGWVNQALAAHTRGSAQGSGVVSHPGVTHTTTVSVNVRNGPSTSHVIVGLIPPGESYRIVSRTGAWARVRLADGTTGYASLRLLNGSGAASGITPASTGSSGPTLTAGVRLHFKPGVGAAVLGLAGAGTRVRVLGTKGNWLRVRTSDGQTGFVYGAYVSR